MIVKYNLQLVVDDDVDNGDDVDDVDDDDE